MKSSNTFEEGKVILINKPIHWTSFDVVKKVRNLIRIKKVGHAGTLDPLATGLLILCTGKFTRRINEFMAREKEYTGSITIGASTPTFDLESQPVSFTDYHFITNDLLETTSRQFVGDIFQLPPIHSAIKQQGKPVYLAARKGIDVILQPRSITIKEFQITEVALPLVKFKVICSTGTYIRSLANDFGAALGCGGYLSSLCRTRIGEFTIGDAMTIDDFSAVVDRNKQN